MTQIVNGTHAVALTKLVDDIGLDEVLNILAALCAVKAGRVHHGVGEKARKYMAIGAEISAAADMAEGIES